MRLNIVLSAIVAFFLATSIHAQNSSTANGGKSMTPKEQLEAKQKTIDEAQAKLDDEKKKRIEALEKEIKDLKPEEDPEIAKLKAAKAASDAALVAAKKKAQDQVRGEQIGTYDDTLGKFFLMSFGATATTEAQIVKDGDRFLFQGESTHRVAPQLTFTLRRRALFEASWDLAHGERPAKSNSDAAKRWKYGRSGKKGACPAGSFDSWMDFEFNFNILFSGSSDGDIATATIANQSELSLGGVISIYAHNWTLFSDSKEDESGTMTASGGVSVGAAIMFSLASDAASLDVHSTYGVGADIAFAVPVSKNRVFEATLGGFLVNYDTLEFREEAGVTVLKVEDRIPAFGTKVGGLVTINMRVPLAESTLFSLGGNFLVSAHPNAWAVTAGFTVDLSALVGGMFPATKN